MIEKIGMAKGSFLRHVLLIILLFWLASCAPLARPLTEQERSVKIVSLDKQDSILWLNEKCKSMGIYTIYIKHRRFPKGEDYRVYDSKIRAVEIGANVAQEINEHYFNQKLLAQDVRFWACP